MILNQRRSNWILAGGFLLAALVTSAIAFTLWTSYEAAEREWRDRLSTFATMISGHARQSIGAADLVLRGITDNVREFQVADQDHLRETFSTRKTFEMMRESVRGVPQITIATIVALNGDIINVSESYPPPRVNLADRDYFQAHLRDKSMELFVSAPVQNRGDGAWTFFLARKIRGPDGEMAGLVITGLKSDYFSEFYKSIGVGVSRLSMHRMDGVLIARYPVLPEYYGKSYLSPKILHVLDGVADNVTTQTETRIDAASDPTKRLVSARKIPDYPLIVTVAATRGKYLAQWKHSAWQIALAGLALSLALLGVTIGVARLVQQLEAARSQAMDAVATKARFVATVSHEIRTPLNAVIGGAAHLLETDLSAGSRSIASLVSVSAQHLLLLINDILDFSRLEASTQRIVEAPFELRKALDGVLAITKALPEATRLDVRLDIAANTPPALQGDCSRMTQILLNLLSNAVKYTPKGSVTLRAEYADGLLRLSVADTGLGLCKADQARLFEPFERGAAASTDIAGTGLGLAITKRLANALGGEIRFESLAGKGSTFTVALPMNVAIALDAAQGASISDASTPAASPLTILLAEDMAANRRLVATQLRKLGHLVEEVANGRQALEAVTERRFDVVLMDAQMPVMSGVEATQRIRALPRPNGATPIIAITGFVEGETHAELRAAGANNILIKPVNSAQLALALSNIPAAEAQRTLDAAAT